MGTETKHTPTPWRAWHSGNLLHDGQALLNIASEDVPDLPFASCGQFDAAHIVRCVNNHDALIKAGRSLYEELTLLATGRCPRSLVDEIMARASAAMKVIDDATVDA